MIGNERQRFCGSCEMNVYNLSGMTREDAESMIATTDGRLCVRFYKRADGSVMTKDCPVGLARVKARAKVIATAFASLIISFFSAIGVVSMFNAPKRSHVVGEIAIGTNSIKRVEPMPQEPMMGNVVIQGTPVPQREFEMGKMAVPQPNFK
jgi:hypothetical protein